MLPLTMCISCGTATTTPQTPVYQLEPIIAENPEAEPPADVPEKPEASEPVDCCDCMLQCDLQFEECEYDVGAARYLCSMRCEKHSKKATMKDCLSDCDDGIDEELQACSVGMGDCEKACGQSCAAADCPEYVPDPDAPDENPCLFCIDACVTLEEECLERYEADSDACFDACDEHEDDDKWDECVDACDVEYGGGEEDCESETDACYESCDSRHGGDSCALHHW